MAGPDTARWPSRVNAKGSHEGCVLDAYMTANSAAQQLRSLADISNGLEPTPIPALILSAEDIVSLDALQYVTDSVFPNGSSISASIRLAGTEHHSTRHQVHDDPIRKPRASSTDREIASDSDSETDTDPDDDYCTCRSSDDGWCCSRNDGDACSCVAAFGNFYMDGDSVNTTAVLPETPSQMLNLDALPDKWPLVECSQDCACGPRCRNKPTQTGVRVEVDIRPVRKAGLGLFYAPSEGSGPLPRGTFIALYAGEYLKTSEARARWADQSAMQHIPGQGNYILSLRLPEQVVHIDPRRIGNVGRFLNHSCEPNCVIQVVRWGADSMPRAAIFAKRVIAAASELTFDYGNASGTMEGEAAKGTTSTAEHTLEERTSGRTRCLCGATDCRGWMPFDETL